MLSVVACSPEVTTTTPPDIELIIFCKADPTGCLNVDVYSEILELSQKYNNQIYYTFYNTDRQSAIDLLNRLGLTIHLAYALTSRDRETVIATSHKINIAEIERILNDTLSDSD